MIRRSLAALRSLLSDGRPDDLCALIEATAETRTAADAVANFNTVLDAALGDPLTDPCHPCDEYAREFHRVVSIWAELMADARTAEFGDEDFAEWSRELMFEGES